MAMHDILRATNVSMQLDTDTRSETMRQTGQQEHGEHEGTNAHEVEMVRHSIFFLGDGSTDQPNRLRTVATVAVMRKLTTLSSYTSSWTK
jgi:hypothetical protein